jgi:putative tricarboxylic transport membrane protein
METLQHLANGFSVASTPEALFFCFVGVTVGTLIGVLPGIGALATISMMLPITYGMDPTSALIMLAGVFYGAQYGSSTAAILLNIPGTPTSAITSLDGYPMSRQGKAGVALLITTLTSFFGGVFSIILMIVFAPMIARFAMSFSAAEYFSVMLLALVAASSLSVGSAMKGTAMVVLGLVIGTVGMDINTGTIRFTMGQSFLMDGVGIVALAIGLFGVAEVLQSLGNAASKPKPQKVSLRSMTPSRHELKQSAAPAVRGAAVGAFFGILPGPGPTIATFFSYALEKRVAKDPSRFGKGAIEGIAAPESANNSAVQASFIPTLSLGLPGEPVMAVLLGALILHGIVPGPQLVNQQPELFWGLIASFWIGNVLLLILNIPLIGIWVRVLTIPYKWLYPIILVLIAIGVYSVRFNVMDVYIAGFFGLIGYILKEYGYPVAPLVLGFILGPLMEENFKRALQLSRGDPMIFVERPISAFFLVATLLVVLQFIVPWLRRRGRS